MLSHVLARSATRRHAISGVPFDCAGFDVIFRGLPVTQSNTSGKISENFILNLIFLCCEIGEKNVKTLGLFVCLARYAKRGTASKVHNCHGAIFSKQHTIWLQVPKDKHNIAIVLRPKGPKHRLAQWLHNLNPERVLKQPAVLPVISMQFSHETIRRSYQREETETI